MRKTITPILYTDNAVVNQQSQNTAKAIKDISNSNLNGVTLSGITLKAGLNSVAHKLGKKLQGYQIVKQNAAATFYESTGSQPNIFLYLNASAPVTVDIYVF